MPDMEQPQVPEQEAPAEAPPQNNEGQEGGDLKALIIGIHNNMLKFKEMIQPEAGIPDEAKAKLDSLIGEYRNLVQSIAQGAQAPAEEAPVEAAPEAPAPGGPQKGRVPMSGGKGAVPAL